MDRRFRYMRCEFLHMFQILKNDKIHLCTKMLWNSVRYRSQCVIDIE